MVDANSLIEGHCKFRDGRKVSFIFYLDITPFLAFQTKLTVINWVLLKKYNNLIVNLVFAVSKLQLFDSEICNSFILRQNEGCASTRSK